MAKRKRKARISTVRVGETPTKERKNHNGGVVSEVVDRDINDHILILRYKAVAECVLDVYLLEQRLTEAEYRAGMKFRHAYMRSVLRIKVEDVGSGCHGSYDMAALMVLHSERVVNEAYRALTPVQKTVVISVCGHDEYAGTACRVLTLHRALEKLAGLWKIA